MVQLVLSLPTYLTWRGSNENYNIILFLSEALKSNRTITELDISNNKIGDVGAKALADALKDNTRLNKVYIGNNNIGTTGKKYLEEAQNLRKRNYPQKRAISYVM